MGPHTSERSGSALPRAVSADSTQARSPARRASARLAQCRLALLTLAGNTVGASLDLQATCDAVASVAVPALADACALDLHELDGRVRRASTASRATASRQEAALRELLAGPLAAGRGPVWTAVERGRPVLKTNWRVGAVPRRTLHPAQDQPPLSLIGLPLRIAGRSVGALTLVRAGPRDAYSAEWLALAAEFAERCVRAIENARLYAAALHAVREHESLMSIASHELRSPLARAQTYADVLLMSHRRGQLDDELLDRSVRAIARATSRIATISADMLDMSRQRGHVPAIRTGPWSRRADTPRQWAGTVCVSGDRRSARRAHFSVESARPARHHRNCVAAWRARYTADPR